MVGATTLGSKGPHVAYACGQPLGRSMDPRTQHRMAAEAREARESAKLSMAAGPRRGLSLASTNRAMTLDGQQRRHEPSDKAVATAAAMASVWHRESSSSSDEPKKGSGKKKSAAPKPKATPALDAYRASKARETPRYRGGGSAPTEHARVRALKLEEHALVQELSSLAEKSSRRRLPL